ncbi:MAG: sulfatase-like hydrolase/transferase [Draconibacterium sp.]|nr:sulfatase-like hydrolase/transferase [Draconibacterium sp.]
MKKRFDKIPTLLLLLFGILLDVNVKAEGNHPNILFIFVDDLNTQLHCYGNETVKSPNIDKLAESGTMFTRAYCQWAVCGPSRASILSGQMPSQTGIRNLITQIRDVNPNIVTLPQYFKTRGYTTAAMGKVFDPRNVDSGHDTKSWSVPYNKKYKYPPEYGPFVKGQYRVTYNTATEMGPEGVGDDGYIDGQICLDALSKMENFANSPDKPFFLAVGFKKPHVPFISPKKYWDLYERDSLKLAPFQRHAEDSPDFVYFKPEPAQYDDIPDFWTFDDIDLGDDILEPNTQRKLIHGYYACISYVDAQVGKLMDKLDELNLRENTIVVLLGDHGYHLGDHNQWGKHTQFENATHAPLIIHNPNSSGSQCNLPVDFLDIYPTLTSLVFNERPAHLTGKDLTPLLEGANPELRPAVTEYRAGGHASYTFRNERYRLTLWLKTSNTRIDVVPWSANLIFEGELYDYQTDSLETQNIYNLPESQEIIDELLQDSKSWWNYQYNKIQGISTGAAIQKREILPFQNPVTNFLPLPPNYGEVNLRIYDLRGNLVLQKQNQMNNIYVGNLKTGQYLVLLEWEESDEVLNFKMVKI